MLNENGLTPKEQILADEYLKTGNGTKSALIAYDTDDVNVAAVIASRNLRKANVKQYVAEQCKIAGLTVPKVLLRLSEELDAERVLISPKGDVIGNEPDYSARHRAIETSIKYVLPEFIELQNKGGGQGGKHLHLKTLPETLINRFMTSDEDEE